MQTLARKDMYVMYIAKEKQPDITTLHAQVFVGLLSDLPCYQQMRRIPTGLLLHHT